MTAPIPTDLDEYTARIWSAHLGCEVLAADVRCMLTLRDLARNEIEERARFKEPTDLNGIWRSEPVPEDEAQRIFREYGLRAGERWVLHPDKGYAIGVDSGRPTATSGIVAGLAEERAIRLMSPHPLRAPPPTDTSGPVVQGC